MTLEMKDIARCILDKTPRLSSFFLALTMLGFSINHQEVIPLDDMESVKTEEEEDKSGRDLIPIPFGLMHLHRVFPFYTENSRAYILIDRVCFKDESGVMPLGLMVENMKPNESLRLRITRQGSGNRPPLEVGSIGIRPDPELPEDSPGAHHIGGVELTEQNVIYQLDVSENGGLFEKKDEITFSCEIPVISDD